MLQLKTTPFHSRTSQLMQANQWRRWSSHSVASAYEMTSDREYLAVRNSCAVFDVSPLCKYHVTGRQALEYLNKLVTRDVSKCAVGGLQYTPWCDSNGLVIDDGTIANLGNGLYRLTAAEPNFRWLQEVAQGFEVQIEDVSDQFGTLAVQGPKAQEVLCEVFGEEFRQLKFYRWGEYQFQDKPLVVSRTGYTGDLGYEVWIPVDQAVDFWDELMRVGKRYALQPSGIWALDTARIEAGLIMLDVDYTPITKSIVASQASSPFELGLGWAVNFNKGNFIGRRALLREKELGSKFSLVGLEIDHVELERLHESMGLPLQLPFVPWREIVPIFFEGKQVGYATCGGWSPTLKRYLALAQVEPFFAHEGHQMTIDLLVDRYRKSIPAVIRNLPFFNPERKRL